MSEIIRDTAPPQLGEEPNDDDEEIDASLLEPTEGFDIEPYDNEADWEGRHHLPGNTDDIEKEDR